VLGQRARGNSPAYCFETVVVYTFSRLLYRGPNRSGKLSAIAESRNSSVEKHIRTKWDGREFYVSPGASDYRYFRTEAEGKVETSCRKISIGFEGPCFLLGGNKEKVSVREKGHGPLFCC